MKYWKNWWHKYPPPPQPPCTTHQKMPTFNRHFQLKVNKECTTSKFLVEFSLFCNSGSRPPIWIKIISKVLHCSGDQFSIKKFVNWTSPVFDLIFDFSQSNIQRTFRGNIEKKNRKKKTVWVGFYILTSLCQALVSVDISNPIQGNPLLPLFIYIITCGSNSNPALALCLFVT